ncbi:MAG: HAD-IA family hydrolase [Alphaproteobacteria bacterium]|nr:HAD-IA family hydrolase [Alphaproteobacteria bacterium]
MSTASKPRLAIFDFDGTLVDSQHAIQACMESAFGGLGLPAPSLAQTHRVIGLPLERCMAILAADSDGATHSRLVDGYKEAFFALRTGGGMVEPMFPGALAALDALAAEGWLLGIATGKARRGLDAVLASHRLADRFVTLQTADRAPGKPDPTMIHWALDEAGVAHADAVMIGDTSYDMAMAKAAGVGAIGVVWGYHSPDDLTRAGADRLASACDELPGLVRELWGDRTCAS